MFLHHLAILRNQLLLPLAAGIVTCLVMFVNHNDYTDLMHPSLILGEVFLPIIIGWLGTGLLLRDPSLELIATTPYRLWQIVLERFLIIVACGFLIWLIVVFMAWKFSKSPTLTWTKMLIANITIIIFFASSGFCSAILLRSWIGGSLLQLVIWGCGLFLQVVWLSYPLTYPFLTLFRPNSPVWYSNRLIIFLTGLILLLMGCIFINREDIIYNQQGTET